MRKKISEYFGLGKGQIEIDFIDIPIHGDIPLYIDPFALHHRVDRWSIDVHNTIVDYFQTVIDAIRDNENDKALLLLSFLREPNFTRLGLSRGKRARGRGIGNIQAVRLFKAFKQSRAVQTGLLRDLEDCILLIDDIGPDKISDIATNIIKHHLIEYTQQQCLFWDIECKKVGIGEVWRGLNAGWVSEMASLPLLDHDPIILIPKSIVKARVAFDAQDYYGREILEYLQAYHFDANTNLVRLLRSGKRKPPTKKTLKEKHPFSKGYLFEVTKDHPDLLSRYKERKKAALTETSFEEIAGATDELANIDYDALAKGFDKIPAGDKYANDFHNYAKGILEAIFYPHLNNPKKEQSIEQGRKRVDIVFQNAAKEGFFHILSSIKNIPCAYIYFECKNYSGDPGNPELDQLTGRFNVNSGRFGFLVCRRFEDKDLFYHRCRDSAQAQRGFVMPLDDSDLKYLLHIKKTASNEAISKFLDDCYRKIAL